METTTQEKLQQNGDTVGNGKVFAYWLKTSKDDMGSSNSTSSKNMRLDFQTKRKQMSSRVMRGIKPKTSVSNCIVFMRNRDRDREQIWTLRGYTEGDMGFLVFRPNSRKVMVVWDMNFKESEESIIPGNTETPDLLDGGTEKVRIVNPIIVIRAMTTKEYCNRMYFGRLRLNGREWHTIFFTVRESWRQWSCTAANGESRT